MITLIYYYVWRTHPIRVASSFIKGLDTILDWVTTRLDFMRGLWIPLAKFSRGKDLLHLNKPLCIGVKKFLSKVNETKRVSILPKACRNKDIPNVGRNGPTQVEAFRETVKGEERHSPGTGFSKVNAIH